MKLTEQKLRDIIRKELISLNEGAYKKNDKGSMLTSIIKAKSAQDYGLDNLIVLHKDIKKVFTSKENKQELLSDLNNVIEYMKKADKFKDTGNDNTIAMVEKYWKQLSGQTVDRTQKTITESVVNEGFSTWEIEFGRGKVSGTDYHAAGKITVKARNTVEAIKKAVAQVGSKDDWMAVDIKNLTKK